MRSYDFREVQPSQEDERWIEEKLGLLADKGLGAVVKSIQGADKTRLWFKQYLKRNARKKLKPVDFAVVEQKYKLTLPRDYKEYISTVGSKTFTDVSGMEGSTTTVLLPQKLDFRNYRRGKIPYLEGEEAEVDGVAFAEVENGDVFVFDLSTKLKDPRVYWHRHEENALEPFARNFTACLKRFVEGD